MANNPNSPKVVTRNWLQNTSWRGIALVVLAFITSFGGAKEAGAATPTYYLYGITSAGTLVIIDTTCYVSGGLVYCNATTRRSSVGSYTGFTALLYASPYFYGVYGGGKLVRFGFKPGDQTYIGDTGYPYIKGIAQTADGNVYVTLSQTSGGNASYLGTLNISNAQVSNVTNIPMISGFTLPPNYVSLTSNPTGGLRTIADDRVHGADELMKIDPQTYTLTDVGFLANAYPVAGCLATNPNNTDQIYFYNNALAWAHDPHDGSGWNNVTTGRLVDSSGASVVVSGLTYGPPVYDDGLMLSMQPVFGPTPTPHP